MKNATDADMEKLNALEAEIKAFAERYGITYTFPKRDKKIAIREAREQNKPIESIMEAMRKKAVETFPQYQEEIPTLRKCVATLH
jgi:hypothetical protein